MSNFEEWKAAKAAWHGAEREYGAARTVVIEAGEKRSDAWETLVLAAYKLSPDEKKQAAEFEFGPHTGAAGSTPTGKP